MCDTTLHVGILVMDQTLNMLGMTSMFVGGFMALLLDNMIPGIDVLLSATCRNISGCGVAAMSVCRFRGGWIEEAKS